MKKKRINADPLFYVERSKYAQRMRILSEGEIDDLDVTIHLIKHKATKAKDRAYLSDKIMSTL